MALKRNIDCQRVCLFCENASLLPGGNDVLCKHRGIVSEDHSCRKFTYDPLKRVPAPKLEMPTLSEDDLI